MVTRQVLGVGLHMSRHSAISHLHRASIAARTVVVDAEERKQAKYTALCDQYCFVPLAVETLGALGEEAATFFQDIGRRIAVVAGQPRSTQFLFQRLSIAIQRGNAASVVGTASSDGCPDDVFYLSCSKFCAVNI